MRKTAPVPLAALLALSLPAASFASTTRLLSLGLDNWQLADEINFWSNPARLKAAPNLGLFEIGTENAGSASAIDARSQWGGFHKSIGSGVFALYVRRPYQTNDFSANASPLTTPFPGGFITPNGVVGVTGLTTASFAGGAATNLPFSSLAAGGITGISNFNLGGNSLALPNLENYLDAIYAWSWGRMDWGLHVNYARNRGGEVHDADFNSGSNVANPGSASLHRLAEEVNLRAGWLWNGFENSWLQMTADFTIPHFSVDYNETRASGATADIHIRNDNMVNGGFSLQFARKLENDSSISLTARLGEADLTGVFTNVNNVAPLNQNGYFANTRKFASLDGTWSHRFQEYKSLLVASVGVLRTNTKQTFLATDLFNAANNREDGAQVDQLLVPLRVAVEVQPWDLVAIRGGIQKNMFSESTTHLESRGNNGVPQLTNTDTAITDPNGTAQGVGLSFGVGLRLVEGLLWDTVVRQTVLYHGPYFVGGASADNVVGGLFAQSTLVYKWGGGRDSTYSDLKPLIPLKKMLSRLVKDD